MKTNRRGFLATAGTVSLTSPLKVVDGKIKVPTGPGLGVDLDPDFVKKHQPVTA